MLSAIFVYYLRIPATVIQTMVLSLLERNITIYHPLILNMMPPVYSGADQIRKMEYD